MSEHSIIKGDVDNGWRGEAAFPFYAGEVGVRERDGYVELAYFSRAIWREPKLPVTGAIDGKPYEAVQAIRPSNRGGAMVIVAQAATEL